MSTAKKQKSYYTVEERVSQYVRFSRKRGAKKAPPSLPAPSAEAIGFTQGEKLCFNPNKCVSYLNHVCDIQLFDGEIPFIYNHGQGIWEELTEQIFGMILVTLMNRAVPDSWRKRYEDDTYIGLKRRASTRKDSHVPEHLVAVGNGVFDVKEQMLKPYSSKYFFRSKSPIFYHREAKCPRFLRALEEIFGHDVALMQVMQEIFGNCLLDTCKAERAVFWHGTGANGKSLLADVLTALVGPEQVSHVTLSSFADRFGLQAMIDKKLNLSSENEMGVSAFNTEAFKAIVSGDRLNVSRKYKNDISLRPTTKLIFLVNALPRVIDTSHGFYRKMLIVPFQRVFRQDEMDKRLRGKLLQELEGILCWALEGAARLYANGFVFSEADKIQQATEAYRLEQNPVAKFLAEELSPQREGRATVKQQKKNKDRIEKKVLLDAYTKWLRRQNITGNGTESSQKFWKLLEQAAAMAGHPTPLKYKKSNGHDYLYGYQFRK